MLADGGNTHNHTKTTEELARLYVGKYIGTGSFVKFIQGKQIHIYIYIYIVSCEGIASQEVGKVCL